MYYHRADAKGIGFDRTRDRQQRRRAVRRPVREFGDLQRCPTDYCCGSITCRGTIARHPAARSGTSSCIAITQASDVVREMRKTWDELAPLVDAERHDGRGVPADPGEGGEWWRDACIAYFQISQRPIPSGLPPPEHPLDYYKAPEFPYAPGQLGFARSRACWALPALANARNAAASRVPGSRRSTARQADQRVGRGAPREALSVTLPGRTA